MIAAEPQLGTSLRQGAGATMLLALEVQRLDAVGLLLPFPRFVPRLDDFGQEELVIRVPAPIVTAIATIIAIIAIIIRGS